MNKNLELLLEAKKRGVLPTEKEYLLEDAKRRGLIPEDNPEQIPNTNAPKEKPASRSVSDVLSEAKSNLGPSGAQFVKDTVYPITNTVDWAKGVANLSGGLISKGVENFVKQDPEARARNEAGLDAMIDYFKNRYNGVENIKDTIATDPVGVASDVATILTLGGGAVSKLGKVGKLGTLEKTGRIVNKVGNYLDPSTYVAKPVGAVLKKGADVGGNVFNYFYRPSEFGELSKGARERLADMYQSSNATPDELRQKLTELGPRAFFSDLNQTFTDVTEGINQQVGPARNMISAKFKERSKFAPQAIKDSLDANMGEPVNVPKAIDELKAQKDAEAAPYYKDFHLRSIPVNSDLEGIINFVKSEDPALIKEANKLARFDGVEPQFLTSFKEDPMSAITGTKTEVKTKQWTGAELDYLKRALKGRAEEAMAKGKARLAENYNDLANKLMSTVDKIISPKNPSKSPWAQGREIAGEGLGYKKQAQKGRTSFQNNMTADELAYEMEGLSQLEKDAYKIGAREALRKTMDTGATSFKPSGDVNVRKVLNSPENQAKLETILDNPQAVDYIMGTIRAENEFADKYNQVMANSATARRKSVEGVIPPQLSEVERSSLGSKSLYGALNSGLAKIENVLIKKKNVTNQRTALDMAKALVGNGISPSEVINGLEKISKRADLTKEQVGYIKNTIEKFTKLTKAPNYQTGRGTRVLSEVVKSIPLVEEDNQNQDLASR